ncbi:hypothetical protein P4H61_11985 [Paenibacillus peoriae]|uniref:hypothetical protein n=1 Tax=Paenibacillus peoriae TaxID=59893 RepID=UPI001110AA15|nr:hypothetical protein [Paenibacillus peoriae]MEC0182214.1 hypothetical protein [Paenibacillus peoriae]
MTKAISSIIKNVTDLQKILRMIRGFPFLGLCTNESNDSGRNDHKQKRSGQEEIDAHPNVAISKAALLIRITSNRCKNQAGQRSSQERSKKDADGIFEEGFFYPNYIANKLKAPIQAERLMIKPKGLYAVINLRGPYETMCKTYIVLKNI